MTLMAKFIKTERWAFGEGVQLNPGCLILGMSEAELAIPIITTPEEFSCFCQQQASNKLSHGTLIFNQ